MNQPYSAIPPQPKKPAAWKVGGATIVSFVAILYVIELIDQLSGHSLDRNGIRPLETDGLWGILFAPLLHGGWPHLVANTVPALVLGFLVSLAGMSRFIWATAIIWIVGGLGTWLIGNLGCNLANQSHRRLRADLRLAGVPAGVRLADPARSGGSSPRSWCCSSTAVCCGARSPNSTAAAGVSWQGHLCGAVAGVLAAYWLSGPERKARERKKAGQFPGLTS